MIPTFDSTFLVEDIHDPALGIWSKSSLKQKDEEKSSDKENNSMTEAKVANSNQNCDRFVSENFVSTSPWYHQRFGEDAYDSELNQDSDNFSDDGSTKGNPGFVGSLFSWTSDIRSLAVCFQQTAGDVAHFVHTAAMNVAHEIALMDECEQREEEERLRRAIIHENEKYREDQRDKYSLFEPIHDYDLFCRNHLLPWHVPKISESPDASKVVLNRYDHHYDEDLKLKSKILAISSSSFYEKVLQQQLESHDDDDFLLDDKWVHLILRLIKIDNNLFIRIQEFITNSRKHQESTISNPDDDGYDFSRKSSILNDFSLCHVFVSEKTKHFWNYYFRQVAQIRKDHLMSLNSTGIMKSVISSEDDRITSQDHDKSGECKENNSSCVDVEENTLSFNNDSNGINNDISNFGIVPSISNENDEQQHDECGSQNSLVVTDDDVEESDEENIVVDMKYNLMIPSIVLPNTIGNNAIRSTTMISPVKNLYFSTPFQQGEQDDRFLDDDDDIDESSYVFCIHKDINNSDMPRSLYCNKLDIASAPTSANSLSSLVIVDAPTF